MATSGGGGANPVISGIVGAVLGGALVAGGFLAFGGDDSEAPATRAFQQDDEDESSANRDGPEVASGLELDFRKGKFVVEVSSARDFCVPNRRVIVFEEKKNGGPERVLTLTSDDEGKADAKHKAGGRYFARMPEGEAAAYGKQFTCLPAVSADVKA